MPKFLEFSKPAWFTNRAQTITHYYLNRLGLPLAGRGLARVETPYGTKLNVPLLGQDAFLQLCGTFSSSNPWNRLELDPEPETIVDLGAHRGFTTLYWKSRFPNAKVFCVEMDERNAAACRELFEFNECEITVSRAAIAAADGSATYRTHDQSMRHRLSDVIATDDIFAFEGSVCTVPAITLASYLDSIGLTRVDLMKVDIEGAEQHLLDSISQWAPRVSMLLMEIHHNIDTTAAKRTLEEAGFEIEIGDQADRTEWWCRQAS
jgi:FkbM family methyltransferase